MKKMLLFPFMFFLTCLLIFPVLTQEDTVKEGEIVIKNIMPFTYACIHMRGPYSGIQNAIRQLMLEFNNQNIAPAGGMIGIYFNNPNMANQESLEWAIGFPIRPQVMVQSPLEKKQWIYTTVAATLHVGSYEKTADTYMNIFRWMDEKGYRHQGLVLEKYLDMDPSRVSPSKLRTEIWIPFEKR